MPDQTNPIDTLSFRKAMGLFATGVAVLAVNDAGGQVVGMTANAITSVSLEPLLLLVCVEKRANITPALLAAEGFSLNFLRDDQIAVSDYFAGRWQGDLPQFAFEDRQGTSTLTECVAALACRRYDVVEGGDHWIILGEVIAIHRVENAPDPLIFFGSRYARLSQQQG